MLEKTHTQIITTEVIINQQLTTTITKLNKITTINMMITKDRIVLEEVQLQPNLLRITINIKTITIHPRTMAQVVMPMANKIPMVNRMRLVTTTIIIKMRTMTTVTRSSNQLPPLINLLVLVTTWLPLQTLELALISTTLILTIRLINQW